MAAASGPEEGATPAAANERTPAVIVLRRLHWRDPVHWLRLGLADFLRQPGIGLFYGGCFVVMGWAVLAAFRHAPAYTLALSAGFLLLAPVLCLGLYRTSQRIEAGERPGFGDSLLAWDRCLGQLAIFGFVLLVLEMLWSRATLVLFALSFDGMPDFRGSLLALFDPANAGFAVAWLAVGAVFATLIFSISVVAMPMLLHRQTDAITAALTSVRLVLEQPGVMALWAAILAGLVLLASLPWLTGLLVVAPVLGHASWHAYRAAVADDT